MSVYSLITEPQDAVGKAIRVDIVRVKLAGKGTLTPNDISVVSQDDKDVKHSARRGAWIAYEALARRGVVSSGSGMARSGVAFDLAGSTCNQISGSSAGLCFLVRMAQALIEEYLHSRGSPVPSYEFAATGILSSVTGGRVEAVKAMAAKIKAALAVLPKAGIVFYPAANDQLDSTLLGEAKQKGITLMGVDTPEQVITFLLEQYGISARHKPRGPNPWRWTIVIAGPVILIAFLGWLSWPPPPKVVNQTPLPRPSNTNPYPAAAPPPEVVNQPPSPERVNPSSITSPVASPLEVRATLLYEGQNGSRKRSGCPAASGGAS